MSEPNQVSSTKKNNRHIYKFIQNDNITDDVTINYSPTIDKLDNAFIALSILIAIAFLFFFVIYKPFQKLAKSFKSVVVR